MDEKWTGEEFEEVLKSLVDKGLIELQEVDGEIALYPTEFGKVINDSWGE